MKTECKSNILLHLDPQMDPVLLLCETEFESGFRLTRACLTLGSDCAGKNLIFINTGSRGDKEG